MAPTPEQHRQNDHADLLATYLVNPWTALYVGYNRNYEDVELEEAGLGPEFDPTDELENDADQVFVKLSYLQRF